MAKVHYQWEPAQNPVNWDGGLDNWLTLGVWPQTNELVAPPHTPAAVARRFVEAEDNYRRQNWNSAVGMYRSSLDIATKALDGVPSGLTFFQRLNWLHDNGRITGDMKSWADHVRVDGNDALHDPEEFDEEDARPLRLFTETFLRYAFELPGEVAIYRNLTPGDPEAAGDVEEPGRG